ncbi:MAG: hypothetical protein HY562_00615 [Ignavibacteriales bacterium]|nr:hypothetical protein [Ignavibacteriales bacterium]
MGRLAMLVVMGFGVAFGFISINIRNATNALTESQVGYYKYTMARNIARTGIQRSLRYIDLNPSVENYRPPSSGSFNGGSYTASTSMSGDTMWLDVRGTFADTNYFMKTKLFRQTKPFPVVNGAISVRASPLLLTMTGKAGVDGKNYDSSGTNLDADCPDPNFNSSNPNKPGFAVMNTIDSVTVTLASPYIAGNPKAKVDTSTQDPDLFMDEYVANADTIIDTPGTHAGGTFGTSTHPWITVVNAGDDTNFSIKFTGSFSGWGILAVRGNVQFAGGIDFHGLVVVDGKNNVIDFSSTGTPKIVGGLIVSGRAASLVLKGTGSVGAKVAYSCEAIYKSRNISKLRYYSVLEWYE